MKSTAVIALFYSFVALPPLAEGQDSPIASPPSTTRIPESIYALEEIPRQFFYKGKPIIFRVQDPGALPPYEVHSTPLPEGSVEIDERSGLFQFTPSAHDLGNYYITVSGHTPDGVKPQQFVISVLRGILPEYDLVAKARPIPPDDSSDYVTVTEVPDPARRHIFNTVLDRQVENVVISGKTVIFDAADRSNLIQRFNGRQDIETLNIYAETLIIRSRLEFPQTRIQIFAKDLRFEDQPGSAAAALITTPISISTEPGVGENGIDGSDGGAVSVFVQSFQPTSGPFKRFILSGGDGQHAGKGQAGRNGPALACFDNLKINDTCVVHAHGYAGVTVFGSDYLWNGQLSPDWVNFCSPNLPNPSGPSAIWRDGCPAVPPGAPGNPGNGGDFTTNLDNLLKFVESSVGSPGGKADAVAGGHAGEPLHALSVEIYPRDPGAPIRVDLFPPCGAPGVSCRIEAGNDSHPGKGADAPDVPGPLAHNGRIVRSGGPNSWLHPFALRAVLNHARDAYLGGNLDFPASIINEYQQLVQAVLSTVSPSFSEASSNDQDKINQSFAALDLEMSDLASQLKNNRDYFGFAAGWVPQLTLGASLRAFSNEIDAAIPILYLSYAVASSAANSERHITSLQDAREKLLAEARDSTVEFNADQDMIPQLSTDASNLQTAISQYQQEVENKRNDLLARARRIIEDQHSFWQQALNTLSGVAQVFPIGQPVLGAIGKGLSIIDHIDENTPVESLEKLGNLASDFSQSKIKESVDNYHQQLAALDPSNSSSAGDYIKHLAPVAQKLAASYKVVNDSISSHSAPQSEIDAELTQLEGSDVEFQNLVSDLKSLTAKKQIFSDKLAEATKEVARLSSSITADWQSIDSINSALSSDMAADDHEAVQQVELFARRTRDRLLKYQYYLAKAYEYSSLTPYDGNFQLNRLMQRVQDLLASSSDTYKRLTFDDIKALKAIYTESLREVIGHAIDEAAVTPHERPTNVYSIKLTDLDLNKLNSQKLIELDMSTLVPHLDTEEARQLLDIEVNAIQSDNLAGGLIAEPIRLKFKHSGIATFRSAKHSFIFDYRRSPGDRPFEWGGTYNYSDTRPWTPQTAAPPVTDALQDILNSGGTESPVTNLYINPGLDAIIQIQREGGDSLRITRLEFNVKYSYTIGSDTEYYLRIVSPDGIAPLVMVYPSDNSDRSLGIGTFTRFFQPNSTVTLTAPQEYAGRRFVAWHSGDTVITTPTLTVAMSSSKTLSLEYGPNSLH